MSLKKPDKTKAPAQVEGEETKEEEPLSSVLMVSIPTGLVIEYCEQQENSGTFGVLCFLLLHDSNEV